MIRREEHIGSSSRTPTNDAQHGNKGTGTVLPLL